MYQQPATTTTHAASAHQTRYVLRLVLDLLGSEFEAHLEAALAGERVPLNRTSWAEALEAAELTKAAASRLISALLRLKALDEASGALTLDSEAALVAYLTERAPDRPWEGDSVASLDGGELAVFTVAATPPERVAALLGYIWTGPMAGEWDDQTPACLIPNHLYVFSVDTTKSQRDDVCDAWGEAKALLNEGTPIRTTDGAGAGTKGTRKCEGVGPVLLAWR